MEAVILKACEPEQWTIVFHRKAANRFFSAIAMGHFKHVSAFAWLPDMQVWLIYDVSFERSRISVLPDTPESRALLTRVIAGNCIVTMIPRDGARPLLRFGLYCTTAIKHLLGLRGGALRPDALFRLCVRLGGKVSDDESRTSPSSAAGTRARPDAGAATAAGPGRGRAGPSTAKPV